jgi:hypothetical protein
MMWLKLKERLVVLCRHSACVPRRIVMSVTARPIYRRVQPKLRNNTADGNDTYEIWAEKPSGVVPVDADTIGSVDCETSSGQDGGVGYNWRTMLK